MASLEVGNRSSFDGSTLGSSLNKRLLSIGNYCCYEMCCLKRKVSAPKRPKDSKDCCPLSFSFEILRPLTDW